jgi:type II secretory pathway pseudopilin PulG
MNKFPSAKKLIAYSLIVVIAILAFSTLLLGSQMVKAQNKVRELQGQIVNYENTTYALKAQNSNLENQIGALQNSVDNLSLYIVSVTPWLTEAYAPPPYTKYVNITLQNTGARSIGGMTLEFKVEGNTTNIGYYVIYVNSNIGVLHVLESKSIRVQLIAPTTEVTQALANCRLTITLMLDQTVLDQQTVKIGL